MVTLYAKHIKSKYFDIVSTGIYIDKECKNRIVTLGKRVHKNTKYMPYNFNMARVEWIK